MRLEKTLELSGDFWVAEDEEDKATGKLTIVNGGIATLELVGGFNAHKGVNGSFFHSSFELIGKLTNGNFVTLSKVIYRKSIDAYGGRPWNIFHCNVVYYGIGFDEKEEDCLYERVEFTIEGGEYFSNLGAFKTSFDNDQIGCSYGSPDPLTISLEDKDLSLESYWSAGAKGLAYSKYTISVTPKYVFKYKDHVTSAVARADAAWLQRLLILSIGKCVNLKDVKGFMSNSTHGFPVDWYYCSRPFNADLGALEGATPIFTETGLSNISEVVKYWFSMKTVLEDPMHLYWSSISHDLHSPEQRFLWLTQAVEPLYSILHPKGSAEDYAGKVWALAECAYDEYGAALDPEPFSIIVKKSRNYLTHYELKNKSDLPEPKYFHAVTKDLRAVIACSIMRAIGIKSISLKDPAQVRHLFGNA